MEKVALRAKRKIGELIKAMAKAQGSKTTSPDKPEKSKLLKAAGISTQDASEYERLAEKPAKEFEAALRHGAGWRGY